MGACGDPFSVGPERQHRRVRLTACDRSKLPLSFSPTAASCRCERGPPMLQLAIDPATRRCLVVPC
jgi:hypothetical protein